MLNPLENLPPFYIGQNVIYIGPSNNGFVNGKKYIVKGCEKKCSCYYLVNVGIKNVYNLILECPDCKSRFTPTEIWLWHELFRPVRKQKFPLITLSKIKETEKQEILISN